MTANETNDTRPKSRWPLSGTHAANGLIGFVFAASGPLAIILTAAQKGGLAEADIASWIFGALFGNGILSCAFSLWYRQPLVFFWTIPGTVLVGPALMHSSYPEVIGAFLVAGLGMLVLGATGLVRRLMDAIPLPIVMGMVAGVFLPFGIEWLGAFNTDPWITSCMTAAFLIASALPGASSLPMLAALAAACGFLLTIHGLPQPDLSWLTLAAPIVRAPAFSARALIELVVPLMIMTLVVQNGQGAAILRLAGHVPPVNAIAVGCGLWSMLLAPIGTVSTCLTGPVNAILTSSGAKRTQYSGAVVVGLLAIGFGLFAPMFTKAMLAAPPAFIATLAGLAMLRVLQTAFTSAFAGPFSIGALIAFLVTVNGAPLFNIGAPFWGLVAGLAASRLLERAQFAERRAAAPGE